MAQHWKEATACVRLLAYLLKTTDPDGIDLYFLGCSRYQLQSHFSTRVDGIMREVVPDKRGDLGEALRKFVDFRREVASDSKRTMKTKAQRPLSVYILTDGKAPVFGRESGAESFQDIADILRSTERPRAHLGLQFIQFGNDHPAAGNIPHFHILDKDEWVENDMLVVIFFSYEVLLTVIFSTIDIESATGNIWKMLLATTDPAFRGK